MGHERSAASGLARAAVRRTAMAFGLDFRQLELSVDDHGHSRRIHIVHDDGASPPFAQWREIGTAEHDQRGAVHAAVDEMVWNVALARRASRTTGAPTGWSIHPVAASILAATGRALPNPADPASWLACANREIHVPNGGHVANAVLVGEQGVLLLRSASLVDASGDVLAYVRTEGATPRLTVVGAFPHTLADALVGRSADSICALLAADPRGAAATISAAEVVETGAARLEVDFHDRLVPLLPGVPGRERWRPRRARGIVQPTGLDQRAIRRWLAHSGRTSLAYSNHSMRAAYARVAQRPGSCIAAPACTPATGTP